jgi:arylsulfatase A-like enzyme
MFANLWAQWLKATPANEGADSANDDSWPGKDEGLTEAESRRVRATYEEQVKYMKEKQGWDFVSSLYMENAGELGLPAQLSPQRQAEHNMEWFTAGALKFLDRQKGSGRPFFLYFAPNIPHSANPQFLKADPRATAEGFVDWHLGVQPSRKDVAQRLAAVGGAPNAAWAIWLDDGIGVVLKKLDELGMADNTLVIFSSDQQTGGKWTCYQGGSRVPFSVRWPGHVKPGENDTVLSSVDVVPTLLELGGGKLPPAARAVVDGQSFVPLLQGKSFTPRPALVEMGFGRTIISGDWEYIAARYPAEIESENKLDGLSPDLMGAFRSKDEKPGCWPSYASYQWKRKLWPSFGQRDQLFNLREDPLEQKNLADNPEYAGRLAEMRAQLANALQPLPHPFGEFKPAGDQ